MLEVTEIPSLEEEAGYMTEAWLNYFKRILQQHRETVLAVIHSAEVTEREETPDPLDQAALEQDRHTEARGLERAHRQLREIDAALLRIQDGTYGYCEDTGEEIGVARLLARPTAHLTLEAQRTRELRRKQLGLGCSE